ncbi:MAG: 2-isopropylmalate synthase, partial [Ignavibacteria bacterium]
NTREIYNTSKMVSAFTGIVIQRNKAIVGENAFSHESGIHQDGVLKNRETYEIMTPESVGIPQNKIVLGRHSGKHGLKVRLQELGYRLDEEELQRVYKAFTDLADKKKEVFDDDLRILMGDEVNEDNKNYHLEYIQVSSGTNSVPTATIRIKDGETVYEDSAIGDGPVDAVFNAVDRALNIDGSIESFNVRSVTSGRQALGEVLVRIRNGEKSFTGRGVSTDVIEASAKAYLSALEQKRQYEKSKKLVKENVNQAV